MHFLFQMPADLQDKHSLNEIIKAEPLHPVLPLLKTLYALLVALLTNAAAIHDIVTFAYTLLISNSTTTITPKITPIVIICFLLITHSPFHFVFFRWLCTTRPLDAIICHFELKQKVPTVDFAIQPAVESLKTLGFRRQRNFSSKMQRFLRVHSQIQTYAKQ